MGACGAAPHGARNHDKAAAAGGYRRDQNLSSDYGASSSRSAVSGSTTSKRWVWVPSAS